MRHLAAYMLLVAGGNEAPTAKDVSTVLDAAGISTDEARLKMLLSELEGKKLEELIEMGKDMLHVGGGMAAAAPAAGGAAPAGAPAAKAAEKPKEEEVDALDGGMDMFGGGGGKTGDY